MGPSSPDSFSDRVPGPERAPRSSAPGPPPLAPGAPSDGAPGTALRPTAPGAEARQRGYNYRDAYGPFMGPNRQARVSQLFATAHRYELTLRKHWWVLVLALCVTMGPVTYHIYTTPPLYRSESKLWTSGKLNLKEGQLYSEELNTFIATQVEFLKSSTLLDRTLSRLSQAHPEWASSLVVTNYYDPPFLVEVNNTRRTSVIELEAVGDDADITRAFLDTLMDEYQTFRKDLREESSATAVESIAKQVKQLEAGIRNQQDAAQAYLSTNNVVLLQEQGSSAGAYAARLSRQLAALKSEKQLLELLTPEQLLQATDRTRLDNAEPTATDDSARDLLMSLSGPQADYFKANQLIELLRAQRKDLSLFLRPNHPKILKLDEDIAQQNQIVDVFRRQSLTQMENRRQAIDLQIAGLEKDIAEWEAKALDANEKTVAYDTLRQDIQRSQRQYDQLLSVAQSVDVNRTLDQETVRVMEPASPAKAVRKTARFLALGLVAGLGLGLGLLYFLNMFDDRFASLSELHNQLPETIIGQIPDVNPPRKAITLELVHNHDERHAFAESFRNLRSWFLFSFRDKSQPRTLLVTSAQPAEGKSTVAANLAATLALAGSRVLLVDGDLRRATVHDRFKVPVEPGLAEILEQQAELDGAIHPTHIPKLDCLAAGEASINPGELFLAPSNELFLRRVGQQYSYVVIDTAPVLAADDTSNLAPMVDGVIFVVRADYTSARRARESLAVLRQRQSHILGIVFNRAISTGSDNSYYRYKDYSYRYKQPKSKSGSAKRPPREPAPASTSV